MKEQVNFYHNQQVQLQRVDVELEEKLARTMFPQKPARAGWQWRTQFSWPKLFIATSVMTMVVLGIYFSKQSLTPKVALAEAFDNTFILKQGEQLYYQKIRFERLQGVDSPLDNTMAVWTDNKNVWFHQDWTTANTKGFIDSLTSGTDGQSCSYSAIDGAVSKPNCVTLFGQENMESITGIAAVQQQYDSRFSNAMFLRAHVSDLGEPNVTAVQYQGHPANTIVYQLPSALQLPEPELATTKITAVQFTITVADQKIVEYKLLSNDTLVEHVTVLEDKIITNQDPAQFFSVENWKQALGSLK